MCVRVHVIKLIRIMPAAADSCIYIWSDRVVSSPIIDKWAALNVMSTHTPMLQPAYINTPQ